MKLNKLNLKNYWEIKESLIAISSILNKGGNGIIYFGSLNSGDDVIGQQIDESTLKDILHVAAYDIEPKIISTISVEFYEAKAVIKVSFSGTGHLYSAFGKYYLE